MHPLDSNPPGNGKPVSYHGLDDDPIIDIRDDGAFIHIRYRDVIDFPKQIRLIDIIVDLHAGTGKNRFVIDTRGCAANYSFMERFEVATYVAEKLRNGIVAVYIIDKEKNLGIVEPTAINRGAAGFRIVFSEEAAIEWIKHA